MDPQDLLMTALRASLVYFFLLLVVRLLGKREVGTASAFDLIVALMLGEAVGEIVYGDVSIAKGLLAISVIAAWHLVNAWASYRSSTVERLTSAPPTVLVEHGKMDEAALARERIHPNELMAELRLQRIDDISEVKLATIEPNGQISVLQETWAKTVQKQDLFPELSKQAEKAARAAKKDIAAANRLLRRPERAAGPQEAQDE